MPLTYESFEAAFEDEDGRERFFDLAQRHGVKPGTAMQHAIGTNLGVIGSAYALKGDVADIMRYELDTWCNENGEDQVGVPSTVIASDPVFTKAFNACVAINQKEMDRLVKSGFKDGTREDIAHLEQYLGPEFVRELYFSLCDVADRYTAENRRHAEAMSRIGARW